MKEKPAPIVGVVMGSKSDWEIMQHAAHTLDALRIAYEVRIRSAHRTPDLMRQYAQEARKRGLLALIAGAGGAAHLPGMLAAEDPRLPVYGVPIPSTGLQGLDALLSIVQMPAGIPVGTLAIGKAGAINAALFFARTIAAFREEVGLALEEYAAVQRHKVIDDDRALQESL